MTDDFFLVISGHLTIHLRDRDVELDPGELFVVPRGIEHCPDAAEETLCGLRSYADTPLLLGQTSGTPAANQHGGAVPLLARSRRPMSAGEGPGLVVTRYSGRPRAGRR
jgi:hypothetical protein